MSILDVNEIKVSYGDMVALEDISVTVEEEEVCAVLGANAAGKTTLLHAISGLVPIIKGNISFDGQALEQLEVHERVEQGLVHVPEGRMVFPFLSVEDNLRLGAYAQRAKSQLKSSLERVFTLFPRLPERRNQLAGTLSGGEQQMLAIGRGLMAVPKLLMLDEPSLGLAPLLVQEVMERVSTIRSEGVTVLIVEQNVKQTLNIADRGYVLENGRLALSGSTEELQASDEVRRAYLGM